MKRSSLMTDSWWVCWRELKHFVGQRVRIIMTLVQPVIWLSLMGNMFEKMALIPGFPAPRYLDYMAPGIITMVTLFGGMFGGMTIIWDRRLGYLHKLMAAPISRASIVIGKMMAIAFQVAFQATIIFTLALLMGVGFRAGLFGAAPLVLLASLLSLTFAGISISLSAVITSHEGLMAVVNFLTMPLMFTSNAMMPLEMMPAWLRSLARWNPLSYAINPMRSLFLAGWDVPALARGIIVLAVAAVVMGIAAWRLFERSLA